MMITYDLHVRMTYELHAMYSIDHRPAYDHDNCELHRCVTLCIDMYRYVSLYISVPFTYFLCSETKRIGNIDLNIKQYCQTYLIITYMLQPKQAAC